MDSQSIRELCLEYLRKYAEKDLSSMEKMFADDIVLRDWKIRVEGKELALQETQKNFLSAKSIAIDVLETHVAGHMVAAELKITVDESEVLYVVDIIGFNYEGRISFIRAYIGRGDGEEPQ